MGLDMYAYSCAREGQNDEFWNGAKIDSDTNEYANPLVAKPRELAYWRKHPNLHGWFEQEWRSNRYPDQVNDASVAIDPNSDMFNGIELEITWDMLERLEYDIKHGNLPGTTGFFFGNPADDYYYKQDLEFIKNARAEIFLGLKVFYNSSW